MAYQVEFTVVAFIADAPASPQRIEDRMLENLHAVCIDPGDYEIEPTVFGYVRDIKVIDHTGEMPS